MKRTTVEEFDDNGKLVKRTVTEEDIEPVTLLPWRWVPSWPPEPWTVTYYGTGEPLPKLPTVYCEAKEN